MVTLGSLPVFSWNKYCSILSPHFYNLSLGIFHLALLALVLLNGWRICALLHTMYYMIVVKAPLAVVQSVRKIFSTPSKLSCMWISFWADCVFPCRARAMIRLR